MLLTKTFGQYKKGSGPDVMESDLDVEVHYNVEENVVEDIESVSSFNYERGVRTDLTAIFKESFSKELEAIVGSVDWREIYMESRREALVG